MSADTQTRVVFLVTTPISESIDRCLYELLQGIDGNRIRTQKIDWDDTSSPVSSIPTINPHLSFTGHFALGVMDRNDWDDPTLTNLQRFHKASFWEHRGSIPAGSHGRGNPGRMRKSAKSRRFSSTVGQRSLMISLLANVCLMFPPYRELLTSR